jgi:hypothetical protein
VPSICNIFPVSAMIGERSQIKITRVSGLAFLTRPKTMARGRETRSAF